MKFHIIECGLNISFKEAIHLFLNDSKKNLVNVKYDDFTFVGTFFKEMKRTEKSIDINGKETFISFDYYLYQSFSLHSINDRVFLVINEPNKYSKNLLEYFSSTLRLKISFKDRKINLNNFIIKASGASKFQVLKARFNELAISKHSKGSIEVTSTQNAITDFKNVFGDIYYDLSKIKVTYFDEQNYNLELTKNGLIILSKHTDNGLHTTVKLIRLLFF